jgi:hypothetical protein
MSLISARSILLDRFLIGSALTKEEKGFCGYEKTGMCQGTCVSLSRTRRYGAAGFSGA